MSVLDKSTTHTALTLSGVEDKIGSTTVYVTKYDTSGFILEAHGTTVPPNSGAGAAVGCQFRHTDGGAGTILYVNEGSTSSCTFNPVTAVVASEIALAEGSVLVGNNAGAAAALDASTDTQILVGNGTTITSVAVSGDATLANDGTLTVASATADFAVEAGKISLNLSGGAASASGILMGVGTSADPATTSTADAKFIEIRSESTATSGDSRCIYLRHSLNGAGVSGETIRALSKIEAAAATCRGAHISLDVASTGSCSGLGVGVDNQILVHDGALTGGTYAVSNLEVFSAGSSTDVSGVTELSFIRMVAGGDATGAATVDAKAFALTLSGFSAGAGNVYDTSITTHTPAGGLKVKLPDGSTAWLAVVSA